MGKAELGEKIEGLPKELHKIIEFSTVGMKPPNRLIFGFGSADKIGIEASQLTNGRVALIISDETIKKLESVDYIASSLSSVGFSVDTFTAVEPEPHLETAEKLFDQCSGRSYSVVVALGGGSVIDISKLSAECLGSGYRPGNYIDHKVKPEGKKIPLIILPTTAGTGSEVSYWIVLSVGEGKKGLFGQHFYGDISIIDPLLSSTMPPNVTASTGIDALTHAIEAMLSTNSNVFTDAFALAGIEKIGAYLRRAVANGEDLEARYYMSMAATISMMAGNIAGFTYAHSVSNIIPIYKPTAHGIGCGLGLPYIMDYNLVARNRKLAKIATAMGEQIWMLSELDAAKLAIYSVARLIKDIGLPSTLQEYGGISEGDLEEMADRMITDWPRPNNPMSMGREESRQFWRNMWDGKGINGVWPKKYADKAI
jgi:alcohol dehydrogenase